MQIDKYTQAKGQSSGTYITQHLNMADHLLFPSFSYEYTVYMVNNTAYTCE